MKRLGWYLLTAAGIAAASGLVVAQPRQHRGDDEEEDGARKPTRKLTEKEINRIRFFELQAWKGPDDQERIPTEHVSPFRVLIPPATVDLFFQKVKGTPGYAGPDARKNFNRLRPEEKLARIAYDGGAEFVDRVDIKTDPEVFMTWKTKVTPIILTNCASSGCHGRPGGDKTGLRLFDESTRPADSVYTNFLQLDEYESGRYKMIDRARPDESLLLAWLTRTDQSAPSIPKHPGDLKIKPAYQNTQAAGYNIVRDWIVSLRVKHPDYGVYLRKKPAPSSAPKDKNGGDGMKG